MILVKIEEAQKVETPHGVEVKKLFESEHVQVMHVTLKPGEELKRHVTPVDAFVYVLKGKGIVEVGEEKEEVKKDELVYLPKDIPHKVINSGNITMRFLVVKTPKQKIKGKILE
jgi:quercetin dioxygenase-like cupin family protein